MLRCKICDGNIGDHELCAECSHEITAEAMSGYTEDNQSMMELLRQVKEWLDGNDDLELFPEKLRKGIDQVFM